jgi:ribose/xylose/arabinose/galactoside ABC-type transport system permease subunit
MKTHYRRFLLLVALCVVVMGFFAAFDHSFIGIDNILHLLIQSSISGITAFGLTLVMKSGHYDFSLGAVVGLAAVISAQVHAVGLGTFPALLATLAVGSVFGLINGALVSYFSFRDYLVTYASMFIANGLDILLAKAGHGVSLATEEVPGLVFVGYGNILGVPVMVLSLFVVTFLAVILTDKTSFGHELRAIGMNARGSLFSGVNVKRNVFLTFIIAGAFYGLAGFLLSSRLISVPSRGGDPYFLGSFATVYLGSVFLRGEPNIIGTLVAAFFMSALQSGFVQVGFPFYFQTMMTAIVIIISLAVSLHMVRKVS